MPSTPHWTAHPPEPHAPLRAVLQCRTCGVERPPEDRPPECPICADERQHVPVRGQEWTSPRESQEAGARLELINREPGVHGLVLHDGPGIGQMTSIVATRIGNVMIEPPAYIDDDAVDAVASVGGLAAILASHPHMYGVQSLWAEAFGEADVYVSAADEQWLALRPPRTVVWKDRVQIAEDMVATQIGGHFVGSMVARWRAPDGCGVLFTGDAIFPVADQGWVTFMRSYPNMIPLSPAVVRRLADHVAQHDYDRLYGNFARHITADAAAAVERSAQRYIAWVSGARDEET
ncbi:hydrolase [Nesterenkonia sp. HG001]|uniref:hydrolase n=1 Tax=Nesterenkonia sp. HG001 TaxID=2983207 RepID=UPI002AC6AEA6|nr:hydrolase [Nesterenkonia sp. HG001]MDZ5079006.1 hydrolase [Nesterenkonia sp. HG001]